MKRRKVCEFGQGKPSGFRFDSRRYGWFPPNARTAGSPGNHGPSENTKKKRPSVRFRKSSTDKFLHPIQIAGIRSFAIGRGTTRAQITYASRKSFAPNRKSANGGKLREVGDDGDDSQRHPTVTISPPPLRNSPAGPDLGLSRTPELAGRRQKSPSPAHSGDDSTGVGPSWLGAMILLGTAFSTARKTRLPKTAMLHKNVVPSTPLSPHAHDQPAEGGLYAENSFAHTPPFPKIDGNFGTYTAGDRSPKNAS